jgi:plastocyanin
MHALVAQLPVILAAEKSRTAFYIIGSVLVVWALIVSLALGLRRKDFPDSPMLMRVVIAISAALVIGTGVSGVITAGTPSKTATASAATAPSGTASTVSLEASKTTLAYNTKHLSAKAGTVTIMLMNGSPVEHNVTISKPGLRGTAAGEQLGATPTFKGGSRHLTLKLAPGKYTFFCSVPGHREAGMEGTLEVH